MPFIRIETSSRAPADADGPLLEKLSLEVSAILGKPVKYVMAAVHRCSISFAGEDVPATFASVKSIGGFQDDVRRELVSRVTDILSDMLSVPVKNIYVTLEDVPGSDWAWQGRFFR